MKRLVSIDILRGLAVILVLFRHFGSVKILGQIGWSGVDLFFVLSGFLVSGLLFKEYLDTGKVKAFRFLIRRGLKIYPAFYFLILFTCLKSTLVILFDLEGNKNFTAKNLLSEIFFIQNYSGRLWAHTWSLAVEEHFYLLLITVISILIFWRRLEDRKIVGLLFLLIAVTCLILRIANTSNMPVVIDTHIYYTHLRLDSLLFGVFLSYLYHFKNQHLVFVVQKYWRFILTASLMLLTPMFCFEIETVFMSTLGLTLTYLGYGGLVILSTQTENFLQRTRVIFIAQIKEALSLVGLYSYSIYLWHLPVITYLVEPFFNKHDNVAFLFYFLLSISIGVLMSKWIERPVLRFRDTHLKPSIS